MICTLPHQANLNNSKRNMEKMARYGKTVKAIIYHFRKILVIKHLFKKTSLNEARCAILLVR